MVQDVKWYHEAMARVIAAGIMTAFYAPFSLISAVITVSAVNRFSSKKKSIKGFWFVLLAGRFIGCIIYPPKKFSLW